MSRAKEQIALFQTELDGLVEKIPLLDMGEFLIDRGQYQVAVASLRLCSSFCVNWEHESLSVVRFRLRCALEDAAALIQNSLDTLDKLEKGVG